MLGDEKERGQPNGILQLKRSPKNWKTSSAPAPKLWQVGALVMLLSNSQLTMLLPVHSACRDCPPTGCGIREAACCWQSTIIAWMLYALTIWRWVILPPGCTAKDVMSCHAKCLCLRWQLRCSSPIAAHNSPRLMLTGVEKKMEKSGRSKSLPLDAVKIVAVTFPASSQLMAWNRTNIWFLLAVFTL